MTTILSLSFAAISIIASYWTLKGARILRTWYTSPFHSTYRGALIPFITAAYLVTLGLLITAVSLIIVAIGAA